MTLHGIDPNGTKGASRPPRGGAVRARLGDDSGSAVIELAWLGILLLVPLIYLVLMLARLQAGSYAVTQAAREAGRSFVTAPDESSAGARAQVAAEIAFEDQGFGGEGDLAVTCTQTPCLSPDGQVTTRATVRVPLPLVPALAREVVPLEVPVSATQVSAVPRYEARGEGAP